MRWYITNWAFNALFRRVMWFVFRKEPEILGKCIGCGRCCKEIVLHLGGHWLRTKRQFDKAVANDPDLERFHITGKDEDGRLAFSCTLQAEDGLCTDYENRLDLCRSHPNRSLYYSGVVLSPYCGYKLQGPRLKDYFWRSKGRRPADFNALLEKERADSHAKGSDDS